ncbi:MAG TPA: immunoglobulin domain-containing protein [Verrucomicrobiae bacterium]|nr:immunoglobulin domain-containing protein [Verrucomicrobiae bacterium]
MRNPRLAALTFILLFGMVLSSHATVLVSNVWNFAARTYPAFNDPNSPYSEMGVDYNASGDLESAWFIGGNATATVTPGHLTLGEPSTTSSASYTTYFTPESSPVTLAGAGDQLKITWVFTPSGVNSGSTSSSGLRLAVVDSPSASRLTSDNSPGSSTYAGYGIFMNMATTLGSSTPFQLMERSAPGTSSAFLSSSGSWTSLANGATSGHTGYASGTQYTLVMTFARNAAGGLDITATMTGGSLNNTGSASISYTDSAPNSFTFDTFGLRPSDANDSATSFDTTLFAVEFIPGATAPSVTTDPQDQTVLVGQNATFSVLTSGTLPLSYQWYYNTNTALTNATGSALTLTNVQPSDAGGYSVIVTNAYGSVTSAVAQLTVNIPDSPSIITQPQDQTVSLGGTASFTVTAGGSEPLSYQWYYNTNTPVANANDPTLTIANVQLTNAGIYSVTVSNVAGGITSSNAVLAINTNPVAPVFTSQPASQVVVLGGTASFNASATGTQPISYQWSKDSTPISGATSSTLTLTNVQPTDEGSYTVMASNSVSTATSSAAVLTVTTTVPVANSDYNLVGFGQSTTGGGVIPDTDPAYRKVYTALDFANALQSAYKTAGSVKVIEIMNDLSLGWNEVGATVQAVGPFRANTAPLLHPVLLNVGESLIDIKPRSGLTIFSASGATIKHCNFNIKSCSNVIIRNLKFDENWEWDESTKGQYDRNDWDFITLGNGGAVSNIWIDHCTFTKSYDGLVDTKAGCSAINLSWLKYTGDDGATNANSWVWQQINSLESNKTSYAFYNFLRTRGFSPTNIVTIIQGHDKTHLAGQNDLDPNNATISMTFHHLWLNSVWDRCVPRLRAGNVHDYNIYADDTLVLAAKRLRNSIAATLSTADQNTLNNTYSFNPPINGAISTENGALLVEKSVYIDCLWPLRNNQTDPSNPAYTGKIQALDTIYQMDSTVIRGNSTDPGNPMGPFQAPIISFSWNLPGNQLPYAYYPDDPAQLQAIVTSPTAGAGAGVLAWAKTNWLMTAYAPTAPFIVAHPHSQTVAPGNSVTFTVVAGGSMPLAYRWYFNTNTPIANATNPALTLVNVQTTNVGTYSVVVTNLAGSTNSTNAVLVVGAPNSPPTLSPIADTNINAGVTLVIAAVATDTDTPPPTLSFSLLNAPTNATLDTNSGVFTWRPLVTQANTANPVTIKVYDSGMPGLSAMQSFNVTVNPLTQPSVISSTVGGQLHLTVAGEVGPDYSVQASTNLTGWQTIFTTNSPPSPFDWFDANTSTFPVRFYRVVAGPPLP